MKITKLSLTNFRSFKHEQTINFAPVTLLFGPNSVGKSTVLMALFYLQQILEKGECDPQRIEALGNKFVGGFKNLVNGRDLKKSIIIKVEYERSGIGSMYREASELIPEVITSNDPHYVCDVMPEIMWGTKDIAIEVEIAWSFLRQTAYVKLYKVYLNNEFIAEVTSDEGGKNPIVSQVNFLHPLLGGADNYWLEAQFTNNFESINIAHKDTISKLLPDFIDEDFDGYFSETGISSEFEQELGSTPFAINARSGALPYLGKRLNLEFKSETQLDVALANDIYSEMLVAPIDNLVSILNSSLSIGPLRDIPDSTFQPNPYPKQSDWHNGQACWDLLSKLDYQLLMKVDKWLSDEDKLDLGYKLVVKQIHQKTFCLDVNEQDENENISNQIDPIVSKQVALWDKVTDIEVSASDIGVGVSQLLPFVVAALSSKKGFVSCEQPELHVHPRVQVAIGDLLTQANDKTNFLIETHSEHLILRILRRIRETNDGELPDGFLPVASKNISIVYLEPTEHGVDVKNIRVNEEGDFVDKWPKGFFAERRGELY